MPHHTESDVLREVAAALAFYAERLPSASGWRSALLNARLHVLEDVDEQPAGRACHRRLGRPRPRR